MHQLIYSRMRRCLFLLTIYSRQRQAVINSRSRKRFGYQQFNDRETGSLRSYEEAVKHVFATYADNRTIYSPNAEITSLLQRPSQAPFVFKDFILTKTTRCGNFYHHVTNIHIILQGLNPDVQYHTRNFHSKHLNYILDGLARHVNEIDRKTDGT